MSMYLELFLANEYIRSLLHITLEGNYFYYLWLEILILFILYQDDDGDNSFHIAAETAKMIRENLDWLIVMLRNPDADVKVRNHRQVVVLHQLFPFYAHLYMTQTDAMREKLVKYCETETPKKFMVWSFKLLGYIECQCTIVIIGYLPNSGKTLRDILEALPREWISEDLMEALANRGVHLSSTMYGKSSVSAIIFYFEDMISSVSLDMCNIYYNVLTFEYI